MSQPPVVIYTSAWCPYCNWAKQLLQRKQVAFEEIRIDLDPQAAERMVKRAGGRTTVPQIFIGNVHVGGYDDMAALDRRGELDPLLRGERA